MCGIDFKNCKNSCGVIALVLSIFAAVWIGVDVVNNIKEGKYIGQGIEAKNTITVSGEGEVYAKPDLALTTFSVITEAKSVAEALTQNTEEMNTIISGVKGQGVAEKDLKTTNFSISPRYEYRKEEMEIYPYPPGKRVLVGYEVQQSLQVKIRDLEKVGQIIEGAAEAGANQVGDLQFIVDKEDEFQKQAREQAIENAKTKAKELASQLGVRLVKITNFQENSNLSIFYGYERAAAVPAVGGGVPQIQTGENSIKSTVSITYEIE